MINVTAPSGSGSKQRPRSDHEANSSNPCRKDGLWPLAEPSTGYSLSLRQTLEWIQRVVWNRQQECSESSSPTLQIRPTNLFLFPKWGVISAHPDHVKDLAGA